MGWLARNGGLETIFNEGSDGFQYEYYVAPDSKGPVKEIFLEYDIMCEAKYMFKYSLTEDKGVFILTTTDQVDAGVGVSCPSAETKVAGQTREEALDYMVRKILEKPEGHIAYQPKLKNLGMSGNFNINIPKLEAALREALVA